MEEKAKTRKAPRSSISGQFVTKEYARDNKATTTEGKVPIGKRKLKPEGVILDDTPIEQLNQNEVT